MDREGIIVYHPSHDWTVRLFLQYFIWEDDEDYDEDYAPFKPIVKLCLAGDERFVYSVDKAIFDEWVAEYPKLNKAAERNVQLNDALTRITTFAMDILPFTGIIAGLGLDSDRDYDINLIQYDSDNNEICDIDDDPDEGYYVPAILIDWYDDKNNEDDDDDPVRIVVDISEIDHQIRLINLNKFRVQIIVPETLGDFKQILRRFIQDPNPLAPLF